MDGGTELLGSTPKGRPTRGGDKARKDRKAKRKLRYEKSPYRDVASPTKINLDITRVSQNVASSAQ